MRHNTEKMNRKKKLLTSCIQETSKIFFRNHNIKESNCYTSKEHLNKISELCLYFAYIHYFLGLNLKGSGCAPCASSWAIYLSFLISLNRFS